MKPMMELKKKKLLVGGLFFTLLLILLMSFNYVIPSFADDKETAPAPADGKRYIGQQGGDWAKTGAKELRGVVKGYDTKTAPLLQGAAIKREDIAYSLKVSFEPPTFEKLETGFQRIHMKEAGTGKELLYMEGTPGVPRLPAYSVVFPAPKGKKVIGVRAVPSGEFTRVDGTYNIECVQQPFPTDDTEIHEPTLPDQDIYGSNNPFPDREAGGLNNQISKGYEMLFATFCPIRYYPGSGEVYYCSGAIFELITTELEAGPASSRGVFGPIPSRLPPKPEALDEVLSFGRKHGVSNKVSENIKHTYIDK